MSSLVSRTIVCIIYARTLVTTDSSYFSAKDCKVMEIEVKKRSELNCS